MSLLSLSTPVIRWVYLFCLSMFDPDKSRCHPFTKEEWKLLSPESKLIMHQFSKLCVNDGMLIRKMGGKEQIVLPEVYHQLVLTELHDNLGHLGSEKVEELARQRFYWPYMSRRISTYIREMCTCVASKQPPVAEKLPCFL